MTTKKRVRVSTAIKHELDALDIITPVTAYKLPAVKPSVIDWMETLIWKDLGYTLDEARRMADWLAGQSRDANPHDLAEEWCDDCRMPWDSCKHVPPLSLGAQLALAEVEKKQPQAPKTGLSLEGQRRLLHETGMFDEMGNFKGVPE